MTSSSYQRLLDWMKENGPRLLVAFSGGVDSTLVAAAAVDALGQGALCVTARSPLHPADEQDLATELAQELGLNHRFIDAGEFDVAQVRANGPERCYFCKQRIASSLLALAQGEGIALVVEGSNADDLPRARPGSKALKESGLRSPLVELGLVKRQVREMAEARDLPNWNRPANACLATRIPTGEALDLARLERIGRAESALKKLHLGRTGSLRVRDHGELARLELGPAELCLIYSDALLRECLIEELHAAGYRYVCLDLDGFRSGSMDADKDHG